MSEEEKQAIKNLNNRLIANRYVSPIYLTHENEHNLSTILTLIEKQEKVIDKMASDIAGIFPKTNKKLVLEQYYKEIENE